MPRVSFLEQAELQAARNFLTVLVSKFSKKSDGNTATLAGADKHVPKKMSHAGPPSSWRFITAHGVRSKVGFCAPTLDRVQNVIDELSELRLFVFSKAVPQVMIDKSTL